MDAEDRDLEAFMDDLEEDKEYRANFNLYVNEDYHPSTDSEADGEDDELKIRMEEVCNLVCRVERGGGASGWLTRMPSHPMCNAASPRF
jgi:hypothetical protein